MTRACVDISVSKKHEITIPKKWGDHLHDASLRGEFKFGCDS